MLGLETATVREILQIVRRTYWQAPVGSPERKLADALIQALEF